MSGSNTSHNGHPNSAIPGAQNQSLAFREEAGFLGNLGPVRGGTPARSSASTWNFGGLWEMPPVRAFYQALGLLPGYR